MSLAEEPHRFQRGYYRRIEVALVIAAMAHAAVLWTSPPYVPRPFKLVSAPLRLVSAALAGDTAVSESVPAVSEARPIRRDVAAPIVAEQLQPATNRPASSVSGPTESQVVTQEGDSAPPVFYAFDNPPRITRRVYPEYPAAAKAEGAEGTVVVNVNVDEGGRIMRAWIAKASAPGILIEAALDAVYKYEFLPGSAHGHPVKCTVAIPFRFSLNVHP